MNLLLVDIGNTNTKMKLSNEDEIFAIQTSDKYTPELLGMLLPEYLKVDVDDIVISSVVPKALLQLKRFFKEQYSKEPIVVDAKTFKGYVDFPEEVKAGFGSDMFSTMNAVASKEDTFLSIDCGTACTFNLVVDHKYVGTSIAPGLSTSHRALLSNAALIQFVSLKEESVKLLATNTEDCVRSGTILGWTFMIDGFIDEVKKEYNLDNLKVYFTGGVSRLIKPHLKNDVELEKDLIFRGLMELYKLNKEN